MSQDKSNISVDQILDIIHEIFTENPLPILEEDFEEFDDFEDFEDWDEEEEVIWLTRPWLEQKRELLQDIFGSNEEVIDSAIRFLKDAEQRKAKVKNEKEK
jgi:hypothetical protein